MQDVAAQEQAFWLLTGAVLAYRLWPPTQSAPAADSGTLSKIPAFNVLLVPLQAVANQPVSVSIEADQREFQLYAGGIFDAPCGTQLDHGVLLVGYGTDVTGKNSTDYWVMKNSW